MGEGDRAPFTDEVLCRLAERGPVSGRYEPQGELARGGQGAILRVWDRDLRRTLAMKVVLGQTATAREAPASTAVDPKTLGRFLEEAQVTSQLDHPGIVPVHELGLDSEGRCYFTMKLVKGQDLARVFELVREGREGWTQTRALHVLLKVCEALAYAHAKDVIHRDLKPANVMVGRFGEVYVMDWGLAKVVGEEDQKDIRLRPATSSAPSLIRTDRHGESADSPLVTMDGDVIGTPAYMSPEQASGDLAGMGPASDVYALGAILYDLLAGHMPYAPPGSRPNAYAIWGMAQHGPPAPIGELARGAPEELVAICEKAMARDPAQRYPETQAMAEDLAAYLEGRVVRAHRTGAWVELVKWTRRNRALAAALLAAFVLLAAGLAASTVLERRAEASALLAEERRGEAEQSARAAERQAYLANVYAAGVAFEHHQTNKARRRLDAAPQALRDWEWHYLSNRLDQSARALPAQAGAIASVAFSADGARLATGCEDGSTRIWNARTGALLTTLPGSAWAFSPDWMRYVAWAEGERPRVRDGATGDEVCVLDVPDPIFAAFAPTGELVATGAESGRIELWDLDTGECIATFGSEPGEVVGGAFSPDGWRLATGGEGRIQLWDLASGTLKRTFGVPEEDWLVIGLAFSPDGALLASTSLRGVVRLWDADSGAPIARLGAHAAPTMGVVFSPDGALLATASDDHTLRLWDVAARAEIATLTGHEDAVGPLAYSPDGSWIASGSIGGSVRIWKAASPLEGTALVEAALEGPGTARLSPDATRIVIVRPDTSFGLWDTKSGEKLRMLVGHATSTNLNGLAFSPDGARLAAMSTSRELGIWSVATGEPILALPDPGASVFSPDGTRIAVGGGSGVIHIHDAASGAELARLTGHEERLTCLAYSPDGSRLASGDARTEVRLWDTTTGELVVVQRGEGSSITALAFSPDGARLVSAQWQYPEVHVWDGRTGARIALLEGHSNMATALAFSPDGTRLASGSADTTIRLWDTGTWEELLALDAGEWVVALAFTPDGTRLVSTSTDTRLRWWDGAPR